MVFSFAPYLTVVRGRGLNLIRCGNRNSLVPGEDIISLDDPLICRSLDEKRALLGQLLVGVDSEDED